MPPVMSGPAGAVSSDSPTALSELQRENAELKARNASLAATATVDRRLADALLGGTSIAGLARVCHELTGKDVGVFGREDELIVFYGNDATKSDDVLSISRHLTDVNRNSHEAITREPRSGQAPGLVALAITVGEDRLGSLVLVERQQPLRVSDEAIASRAAAFLRHEMLWLRRTTNAYWNARSALTRQLLHGSARDDELRSAAAYLGITIDAAWVVAYVLPPPGEPESVSDRVLVTELQKRLGSEVLAARGPEGIALLIEVSGDEPHASTMKSLKQVIQDICSGPFWGSRLSVGLSSICDASAFPRAYRESREVALCVDRLAPNARNRVLSTDDLGPTRLFVARSDLDSLQNYVRDTLGRLLEPTDGNDALLHTLEVYFGHSGNIRHTARTLNLHENTIRLRLGRIQELTGLDMRNNTNDYLSTQTAMLVRRLRSSS